MTSDFGCSLVFTKNYDGEKGGWEGVEGGRRGLNAVIDMSEDKMLVEVARVKELEEFSGEEEESSDDLEEETSSSEEEEN